MGKDKDTAKKTIMPSTTRRGTDLPSRPHFSPNATTAITHVIRKTRNILPNSPLSRMSSGSENELSVDDTDEVGTPVSSIPFSDSRFRQRDRAASSKSLKCGGPLVQCINI